MSVKNTIYSLLVLFFIFFVLSSIKFYGGSKNKLYKNQVVIHNLSDPKGINPTTVSDATTRNYIAPYIFQNLISFDYKTLELIPVLATEVPAIIENGNKLEVTFNIRPEAKWDNDLPVTAADVLFSMKSVMCPGANTVHLQSTCDFVNSIITYPNDIRKITFICDKYMDILASFPYEVRILPEYIFDSKKILRKYSFKELKDNEELKNAKDIKEFTDVFNSSKFARDESLMLGSGAYKLTKFETGQRVILEKKKNWWGHKLSGINHYFDAYPEYLIYEVINDFNTAFTALKNEQLDFIFSTPIKPYIDLDLSPKFTKNFVKSNPTFLGYQCIGMNHKDPILSDVLVRKALAHLTNVNQMIDKLFYGQAKRITSSVSPEKSYHNNTIKPYDFNVEKAVSLLKKAGWKDSDRDGILDKKIGNKKIKLELNYNYNSGNPLREMVGLLIQKSYKQAGIVVNIKPLEWSLYLDELRKHNCQMWYQGWASSPGDNDDKQIYHTSSAVDGSNCMSFGNALSDKLLDDIRVELSPEKRHEMYLKWQVIQHEELPYIYLLMQNFRNAIHKRFENVIESSIYPGIWFASLKVKKEYNVKK